MTQKTEKKCIWTGEQKYVIQKNPFEVDMKPFGFENGNVLTIKFDQNGKPTDYAIRSQDGRLYTSSQSVFCFLASFVDWNSPKFCKKIMNEAPCVPGDYVTIKRTSCYSFNNPVAVYSVSLVNGVISVQSNKELVQNIPFDKIQKVHTTYWFINSHGQLCKTYEGKDDSRDTWTLITGNRYKTDGEARRAHDKFVEDYACMGSKA